MSEALRPWIREYFESYVSRYDDLGKIHMRRGKAQILSFLTFPKTDEEFLWASLSDKEYIIPARFTLHAMKLYNDNPENEGRPLTSRRSAVSRINCKQILRCKPPLGAPKGLSPSWQIAFEVDEVEVIGCEGEPQFGKPREFNEVPFVQKFLQGLDEGRGNVLRKREGPSEGPDSTMTLRRNQSGISNDSERSRGSSVQTDPDFEKRYRKWQHEIKSLGLLHCYEYPEVDSDKLEFKNDLDGSHSPHPPFPESESIPCFPDEIPKTPARTSTAVNHHTTPSQWSPSAAACSSPPNLTDNERVLSSTPSPPSNKLISDYQNDSDETRSEDNGHLGVDDAQLSMQQTAYEAKVLVPDSDISHSQSQPLPDQKPVEEYYSLTMFSVPETSLDSHQKLSQLNDNGASPSTAGRMSIPDPTPHHSSPTGSPQRRKRKRSSTESDEGSQNQDPIVCAEQLVKLSQPTGSPLHDPSIWRKPSFMASSVQQDVDTQPQDRDNNRPEKPCRKQTPEANDVNNAVGLKLGGWKPDWSFESIPGVMTHEKLKALLSDVICKREARPHKPG